MDRLEFAGILARGIIIQPNMAEKLMARFGLSVGSLSRWITKTDPPESIKQAAAALVQRSTIEYRQQVLADLREEFPGRNIVCIPNEECPDEIVVELGTTDDGLTGLALAVIWNSAAHHHNEMTEVYHIEDGVILLYVSKDGIGTVRRPMPGENYTIEPGTLHWADGNAVRVRVESSPPWTPKDHIQGSKDDY